MRPEGYRGRPVERPAAGSGASPTSKPFTSVRRAVILEEHPAIGAVLEHLLTREGYRVELLGENPTVAPGPALLLVGDLSGLHVFEVRDTADALARLLAGESPKDLAVEARGICAFVPIPFGSGDVLRVVRAVGGFDGRRRNAAPNAEQRSGHELERGEDLHDVRGR